MKGIYTSVLFLTAVSFGAACQSQNSPTEINQTAKPEATATVNSSPANPAQAENKKTAPQEISFYSPDGTKIVGTFYAASEPNSPAVLLLHQWESNRASFGALAKQLQSNGIAALAIDGRGFGESLTHADGSKVSASRTNEVVGGMKSDVAEAVKFLAAQPNVDKSRIGITGASYGSSLAINHAGAAANIKAVALLSPGLNYFGNLATEPAIENYGARPVLLVAAEDDTESAAAARRLDSLAAGERHKAQIYERGGHGTAILSAKVGLDKLLIDFFKANLG